MGRSANRPPHEDWSNRDTLLVLTAAVLTGLMTLLVMVSRAVTGN